MFHHSPRDNLSLGHSSARVKRLTSNTHILYHPCCFRSLQPPALTSTYISLSIPPLYVCIYLTTLFYLLWPAARRLNHTPFQMPPSALGLCTMRKLFSDFFFRFSYSSDFLRLRFGSRGSERGLGP